jgi:hypothetical protein
MSFLARLHVLFASAAPWAVVIRRGPSKSVCSILWDRRTDTFELGQWLRGRIYERRSDLSPDGRHLIYFAMNGRWTAETKGSWTAISRAPWLKATALFGKGDCWNGGGLFTSKTKYWINDGYGHVVLRDTSQLTRDPDYRPSGRYGGECPSVYYHRLQRDGWMLKDKLSAGVSDECTVFEKKLPKGWRLRKYAHAQVGAPVGHGCYWDEHELEHPKQPHRIVLPKWEWAELDGETVVWAEDGRLYRAPLSKKELGPPKLLFDFNEMKFEARPAPY